MKDRTKAPTVEDPSLTCNVMVRRDGFRTRCNRETRRYRVSLGGSSFPDQHRCYRHAHILRNKGFDVTLVERQKKKAKT